MKDKIRIIAKFHRTDLVICSHSRERKPPSYSRRNTVFLIKTVCCDPSPELSRQDDSDEGSQHMVLCRINKNYP